MRTPADTSHTSLPFRRGDVVGGRYRLEEFIGAGGMAAVLAATHLLLDERVALKFEIGCGARTGGATERLLREARVTAKLRSENVVRVLDVGIDSSGLLFVAMELLRGEDLHDRLATVGRLPVQTALAYALEACDALSEAHALGVVHRDIKPSNLYVAKRANGGEIIKLLDFGASKIMQAVPRARDLTGDKTIGSPSYMAPEQLSASAWVDGRADVWSLAVVLFECLAGHPPYRARTLGEYGVVLGAAKKPPRLRALRSDIPRALDQALERALAIDPADCTSCVDALAGDLAALLPRWHPLRCRILDSPRRAEASEPTAQGTRDTATKPASKRPVLLGSLLRAVGLR